MIFFPARGKEIRQSDDRSGLLIFSWGERDARKTDRSRGDRRHCHLQGGRPGQPPVTVGADVRVIMTESATRFVTPLTFQTLSRNRVAVDTFDEQDPSVVAHIDLADHADLFVIAPATANILAKMAHGLGDEMLSTTLLATRAPILVAPAMNVHMYQNRGAGNLRTLKERGFL